MAMEVEESSEKGVVSERRGSGEVSRASSHSFAGKE